MLAHAAAVALIVTGTQTWVMAAGGILAGATIPQLGALSAARWAALLPAETLPTAFALEALANELAYLTGPALVSVIGYPVVGTTVAATLVVTGGLALAAQRRTAPPTSTRAARRNPGRSLLRPRFAVLVGVNLGLGGFFGAMPISVTAFAVEHGSATILFATSSGASLLAGWLYGLRRWRTAPRVQLALVTCGMTVACLPSLVADSPLELGMGLALTGLAVPVVIVACSISAEAAADRAVLTQAFAWLASASAAGSALAAAAAGWAVDAFGPHGGFAVAAASAALMAVITCLCLA